VSNAQTDPAAEARDSTEIDNALAAITTERAGAVIVHVDGMLLNHRTRIADHAARRRLPTVSGQSDHAEAGGLLAYGPSLSDGLRRAATYVDKILKGVKPADLPVEQPTKFELRLGCEPRPAGWQQLWATSAGSSGRWFISRARNHLQTNRAVEFRFEITA
jgi:hypothetical protein